MEPKDFDSINYEKLTLEAEQQLLVNMRLFAQFRSENSLPPLTDFYLSIQHLCSTILWVQDEIFKNSKDPVK